MKTLNALCLVLGLVLGASFALSPGMRQIDTSEAWPAPIRADAIAKNRYFSDLPEEMSKKAP